ncbi:hypothetical protein [Micromonospora purpureochromogenes]|uniref:Aminoglycoside phosphotransferase domain-containing protein n=1 Tax=Micromonospora purpureochromogenes TaxID=47872 RepID=A0ABX2RS67_9ACTN|nr:hypothetical protein [Micromonospora purpureochromogenes]NYF59056.1 hypothetical protein [Micromonospora purpureochromogenes]
MLVDELVDAWSGLGRSHRKPERINVLKNRHEKPKVCRLVSGAPAGGDIIAKRSSSTAVEPVLYERVLATVPGTPRCHGIAPGRDSGGCWIFLEHVEGEWYAAGRVEHRTLTARWLNDVYSITSNLPLSEGLTDDVRPALVHGDLQSKKVRIRRRAGGVRLIAFDWEFSGFGVPAADFAEFAVGGRWRELSGILEQMGFTYGSPRDRLRRLATAGRVFRLITWFEWASRGARHASPRSVNSIALYDQVLDECLTSLNTDT